MLVRTLISRLGAEAHSTAKRDLAQLPQLLQRVAGSQRSIVALRRRSVVVFPTFRRSYATEDQTTPKKRATKSAGEEAGRKKKPAAKKPAAKKKKKETVKKPAKPKAKKAPSERDLFRQKLNILKEKSLIDQQPELSYLNPYAAYVRVKSEEKGSGGPVMIKECAPGWKDLPDAEREHFAHLAAQTKVAAKAQLKAFVESHPPSVIHEANMARRALSRVIEKGLLKQHRIKGIRLFDVRELPDERTPKRPGGAYALFVRDRWDSGDFDGVSVGEAGRQIGKEWRELSSSEKQKYLSDITQRREDRHRILKSDA